MLDKVPPQSIEAEMSVLGGIMLDNTAIDIAGGIITTTDFYREAHRKIFEGMLLLSDISEPIDLVTLANILKSSDNLEAVGGGAYLAELVDYVPTAANIAHYCKIVKERAIERTLITCAQEVMQMVYAGEGAGTAVAKLESALTLRGNDRCFPVSSKQITKDAAKRIEQRYETKEGIQGIPYGIPELDEVTSGMHRGDFIVIAGRPSMGKSALVGNIFKSVCSIGLAGQLFNLEMNRLDVMDRQFASYGINYGRIRNGHLRPDDFGKLSRAWGATHEWKFWIDDTPGISLREIKSKAKKQKREHGLDVMAVDYLQLMGLPGKDNRNNEIGAVSRGLKNLARELDIVVIGLSQLNRGVDARADKRPVMSDLRESGEIEQDADVILFPFRPAAYCEKCRKKIDEPGHLWREHESEAEIIIEKQRNGPRNIAVPVCWIGEFQRFEGVGEQ